jgi:hypothetical protein
MLTPDSNSIALAAATADHSSSSCSDGANHRSQIDAKGVRPGSRTVSSLLTAVSAAVAMSVVLSGCGVFCSGAGGSGTGYAGSCGTSFRF